MYASVAPGGALPEFRPVALICTRLDRPVVWGRAPQCQGSPTPENLGKLPRAIWSERTFPRLKRSLAFLLPDGWRGEVVDMSAAGLRVLSVAVLEPKSEVEGTLVLEDGDRIPLKAKVIWATPPDHKALVLAEMGLELQNVPETYLRALARLFAEQ